MLEFGIIRLDIAQSYFFGEVEFRSDVFKANIQGQRRGKVLKLPFRMAEQCVGRRMLTRVSGPGGLVVEDWLVYKGKSEWLEIDSDEITYFFANHQEAGEIDMIEIDESQMRDCYF